MPEKPFNCRKAGISFDVVPGVSAASAVATYAGVPLTSKATPAIHVLNADQSGLDLARYGTNDDTVVILGSMSSIGAALDGLLECGRPSEAQVVLVERGTTVRQSSWTTTLADAETALSRATGEVSAAVVSPNVALREEFAWFETKPLFGWKVLVPRTQAQAGPTVERLAAYGAVADVVPTISVEPPRTPQQMEKAVRGLVTGRYEWIGFTSVNAVRAVRERFEELGLDARAFAGLKVAAVGGVTAAALREWGINPDLVPVGEQSAAGLLEDVAASSTRCSTRSTGSCCPVPTSRPRRSSPACATWAGRSTMSRPTGPSAPRLRRGTIRDAIKGGDYDAVVFTSSSTVRNLVGIAGKPHAATVVACIGPATAKTAQEHGLRVDVLAPEASALSLVDALAGHGVGLAVAAAEAGQPVQRPSDKRPASRRRAR